METGQHEILQFLLLIGLLILLAKISGGISVVEENRLVDEAIRATESIMGDLTQKGKGILFVVPLDKVIGYHRGDK